MKKETVIDVNVSINVDAVRAAASNSKRVIDVALEIPAVDPRDLCIDDQIFGLTLLPVNDTAKKSDPDTSCYPAVQPILVETLSGKAKPGYITINGTIDISKEAGRVNKIEDCFFVNQSDARAVCRVITEVEHERSLDRIETEQKNATFLQKLLTDDRF
jgi:hypothetical protein